MPTLGVQQKRPHYFKEWRKHRRLSQEKLAERMNALSNYTVKLYKGDISNFEKGERRWNEDTLNLMADALDCSPGDLLSVNPLRPRPPILVWWQNAAPHEQEIAVRVLEALRDKKAG